MKEKVKLSPYQVTFFYEQELHPSRYDYNITFIQKITGSINVGKLSETVKRLTSECFIYNSKIIEEKDELYWLYSNDSNILKAYHDSCNSDSIDSFIKKPFNLKTEFPCRFALFKTPVKNEFIFIAVWHHIVMDGAKGSIFSIISKYYNDEKFSPLPSIDNQIKSFEKLNEKFNTGINKNKQKHLHFWEEHLIEFPSKLTIQHDSQELSEKCKTLDFSLKHSSFQKLKDNLNINSSDFNIFLSVFALLISRYTGESKVSITYPVSMNKDDILYYGVSVNTIPAGFDIDENKTFEEHLTKRNIDFFSEIKHSKLPVYNIFKGNDTKPSLIGFAQTNLKNETYNFKNCKTEVVTDKFLYDISGSDISFEYEYKEKQDINFRIKYKAKYSDDFIKNISNHYIHLLQHCLSKPLLPLNKFQILLDKEYKKIVYDWNKTETPYPKGKTIHQLFEKQVEKTPNNIAVVFKNQKLTYKELNKRANQLAFNIRKKYKEINKEELPSDTLIGIYIERSIEMIIGILGILKSGAAYVPFDTADPEERLKFKIDDCNCEIILTSDELANSCIKLSKLSSILLDIKQESDYRETYSMCTPINVNKSTDLAYMIYTSGSTGTPKGVLIEHYGVINLVFSHNKTFNLSNSNINFLQFASLCFDASVSTIYCNLLFGNKLNICPDTIRKDSNLILDYFEQNKINFIDIPASFLPLLKPDKQKIKHLKYIIVAGDVCDKNSMEKWCSQTTLINAYGPTEATVCATLNKFSPSDSNTKIGKTINNKTAYILDKNLNPLPVGVPGELFIGGDGLSRGYRKNKALSLKCFIANPFSSSKYSTIYKTGDKCMWLPDGSIEFIGRIDNQIKIRGFRVELGEIENALTKHKSIKQSAVILNTNSRGEKILVAYYSLHENENTINLSPEVLRNFLLKFLPDFMIPSTFISLDKMPLNINGKIDRKELSKRAVILNNAEYVPPTTDTEIKLINILENILSLDKIGLYDNFYQIGGNSIMAIKIANAINNEFKVKINASEVLQNPEIEKLVLYINLRLKSCKKSEGFSYEL